jgi:hypothetical protein
MHYLTRWAGYGSEHDTWQKASDFNSETPLKTYWNTQAEADRPRKYRPVQGSKAERAKTLKKRLRSRR